MQTLQYIAAEKLQHLESLKFVVADFFMLEIIFIALNKAELIELAVWYCAKACKQLKQKSTEVCISKQPFDYFVFVFILSCKKMVNLNSSMIHISS